MPALSGYRLGTGTIAHGDFDEDYAIESFPIQSDQDTARKWNRPGNDADIVNEAEELVEGMSSFVGSYGYIVFTWQLRMLSPLMVKYVRDTFFGSTGFSAAVTVRTFNRGSGAFEVYHATAKRKLYIDGATPAGGGYDQFVIDFDRCVLETA